MADPYMRHAVQDAHFYSYALGFHLHQSTRRGKKVFLHRHNKTKHCCLEILVLLLIVQAVGYSSHNSLSRYCPYGAENALPALFALRRQHTLVLCNKDTNIDIYHRDPPLRLKRRFGELCQKPCPSISPQLSILHLTLYSKVATFSTFYPTF